MRKTPYTLFFKRAFDFLIALVVLVLLSPLYAILAVAVRVKLGTPVIFAQERPGKNGEIFRLYKFRTMTNERDENGELLPDEVRLTKFGRFLRSTSLDELPEFVNVLRGDMSLIGPRPLLVQYLPLYTEEQMHRHDVLPGLTGLAQCSGRNLLSWDERFALDVQYVRTISFRLDISIVFRTVLGVLRREGISSDTSSTMEAFVGSQESEVAK